MFGKSRELIITATIVVRVWAIEGCRQIIMYIHALVLKHSIYGFLVLDRKSWEVVTLI